MVPTELKKIEGSGPVPGDEPKPMYKGIDDPKFIQDKLTPFLSGEFKHRGMMFRDNDVKGIYNAFEQVKKKDPKLAEQILNGAFQRFSTAGKGAVYNTTDPDEPGFIKPDYVKELKRIQ